MNTALSPVDAYADAVRAELADLSAEDLAEISEDVRDHVGQVAQELGPDASADTLTQRLGTPAQYATELRSAAGYPPSDTTDAPHGGGSRPIRRLVKWSLRTAAGLTAVGLLAGIFAAPGPTLALLSLAVLAWLVAFLLVLLSWAARDRHPQPTTELSELPEGRWLRARVRSLRRHPAGAAIVETIIALRPAWWVLRAWIAVQLLATFGATPWLPLPMFPGAAVLFLVAVVASVWLGRRAVTGRQTRTESVLVAAGNVVAVLGLAWVVGSIMQISQQVY